MNQESPDKIVTDELLAPEIASGSQSAFVNLITRKQRELYRFFRLLGRDEHEADDCVQETFLRLYAYRHRLRSAPGALRVLLYRIARNVWADALRKERRSPTFEPLRNATEPIRSSDGAVQKVEGGLDARWALDQLPEKLRDVVLLSLYQGLAYREVASALDIPLGTVKSRMSLAMTRLREVLRVPTDT